MHEIKKIRVSTELLAQTNNPIHKQILQLLAHFGKSFVLFTKCFGKS